jgi:hypothetical protein
MQFLDLMKKAWSAVRGRHEEPWATDEGEFERHFEHSYAEFAERLGSLDHAHMTLYEKTIEINPEAGVCWVFFIT